MKTLLAIGAAWIWAGAVQAQCATVEPVAAPEIRLDPLNARGAGELMQPFLLTFHRVGSTETATDLRYQIVDEDSNVVARVGLSQGPAIEFQSADASNEIGAFRSEAYALMRTGRARFDVNDTVARTTVFLRLTDLRADLAAGVYREQFTVRYWCGDATSSAPFEQQAAVAVAVQIPNVLSANIAGASTTGEIDFMDFSVRSRALNLSVRSTGPYTMTARSANGGALLREGARLGGDPADRVAYQTRLDGRSLSLDGRVPPPMSRAGLAGRQMALEVEVEDTAGKRAGLYADTLLVTFSPVN